MEEKELVAILETSGIPFRYYAWPRGEVPSLPYGVYLFSNSNNFHADGVVYQKISRFYIELYTVKKEPDTEHRLEDVLAQNGIGYRKSEAYIESERFFQILYEIEV